MPDSLLITLALPPDEAYRVRLVPIAPTREMGPWMPMHNRKIELAPGDHRTVRAMQMAAYYVHLIDAPIGARGRFIAAVAESSRTSASFVPLHRTDQGPPDPDINAPIVVKPGETRAVYLAWLRDVHLHEIDPD